MYGGTRSGASPSGGGLRGEPGGRATLLGTPKVMLSKALEMGVSSHRGPLLGNVERHSFPRAFERSEKIYLFRDIFMRNLRDV